MRQALYRKYRSRSFDDVVGQDHITRTLQRAIKTGRISHAYLFTGPRGVGKTSVARILAHAVNQFDYKGETTRLDIIEIDAASKRRIDEIRDLREKVAIAPVEGKYKVYIVDEVHMLTREAFNALLKTLEEPPAHTIFILATTEAHKLPETIISRTQRFEFKPISGSQAAKHLKSIAKSEKIQISPEAINLLAEFGSGSFRDSIGYLDQLSSSGSQVTEDAVRQMLGIPSARQIDQLLQAVKRNMPSQILETLQLLKEQGIDAAAAASALATVLRQQLIDSQVWPPALPLLKQLIEVPAASRPYDYLEISLLEAASFGVEPVVAKNVAATIAAKAYSPQPAKSDTQFSLDLWPQVLAAAKSKAASIYTALKLARPQLSEDGLVLVFQFPLHQKKLNQAANKALVADLIEDLTGQKIKIDCSVDKTAFDQSKDLKVISKPGLNSSQLDGVSLGSINSVFGGAEVLEA